MTFKRFAGLAFIIAQIISSLPGYSQGKNKFDLNPLRISYFGKSVMHPGVKVSSPIINLVSDSSRITREFAVSPGLGIYYHPGNHTGIFLSAEAGFKIVFPKGLFLESYVGAGYLRTFLDGKTYVVAENGDVKRKYLAGDHQFMPSLGIGIGRRIIKAGSWLDGYFFRAGGFLQYPYNSMWLPNLNVEIGAIVKLPNKNS